jgi:alkaline phosphatase
VVLVIGDGMGPSQITFARDLLLAPGERFAFESLPVTGLMTTWSTTNAVTDSAAAATAMAAGVKTYNEGTGVDPAGRSLVTLADRAAAAGWKVGYVTTSEITHATPASFYAEAADRHEYDSISAQLVERMPAVAIGGGRSRFLPGSAGGKRHDGRDLLAEARWAGIAVVTDPRRLAAAAAGRPDRLLAVLAGGHLPYRLDRPADDPIPDLAALTRVALDLLSGDGGPFFLMVEGGRIDHAAHTTDPGGTAAELADLDRAVAAVLEHQRAHPEVLVVLTADHATGGLAVNDSVDWELIRRQHGSVDAVTDAIRGGERLTPAEIDARIGLGPVPAEVIDSVADYPDEHVAERFLGLALSERNGITWIPRIDSTDATGGHTGEDVPLYAGGPGAERFCGALDNTDVANRIAELLGWAPLNPGIEPPRVRWHEAPQAAGGPHG